MARNKNKICRSEFNAYPEFFERVESDDGAGGQTITWTSRGNVYCKVIQSNASEGLDNDGLATTRRVSFYTSYRSDLSVKDRVSLDGLNHNVVSVTRVDEDGVAAYRGKFLRIDTDSAEWFGV